jgi:hypothetical protein
MKYLPLPLSCVSTLHSILPPLPSGSQASSRACVGKGAEAVVNLDVHKCWHLLADDFTIDNAWEERVMKPLLAQVRIVRTKLGCAQWAPSKLIFTSCCSTKKGVISTATATTIEWLDASAIWSYSCPRSSKEDS